MSPSLAAETSRSPVAEQPKESPIMPKSPIVPLSLPPERKKWGSSGGRRRGNRSPSSGSLPPPPTHQETPPSSGTVRRRKNRRARGRQVAPRVQAGAVRGRDGAVWRCLVPRLDGVGRTRKGGGTGQGARAAVESTRRWEGSLAHGARSLLRAAPPRFFFFRFL
uniref:Uncharacterized protein n=1 Tax=Arundo donax TaxID=35708 RepID=A0A0A8ZZD6_ARUDO